MICFSGCLMSSVSLQKLFCEVCSALKCSFEEFVREKVVFPSYSSAIFSLFNFCKQFIAVLCFVSFCWDRLSEQVSFPLHPNTQRNRNFSALLALLWKISRSPLTLKPLGAVYMCVLLFEKCKFFTSLNCELLNGWNWVLFRVCCPPSQLVQCFVHNSL